VSAYRDAALVTAALRMAPGQRVLDGDLIHPNRGSQYTADAYLTLLEAHGVSVSMSHKGKPYNNAR
jgi:putative transposase